MQEDGKSWNEVSGLLTWGLKIYLTILDLYGQGIVSAKEIIAQTKLHPFVVNKKGRIIDPTVERSAHPLLDAEALRVIKRMPKWKPGRVNGEPVNVKYRLPITFKL